MFNHKQLEIEHTNMKDSFEAKLKSLFESNDQTQTSYSELQSSSIKMEQDFHRLRLQIELILKSFVSQLSLEELVDTRRISYLIL